MKFTDCIEIVGSKPSVYEGTKQYVSTGAVEEYFINKNSIEEYTYKERPSRADLVGKDGDILFAKMAETKKTIIIDKKTENYLFSTGFFAIRPRNGVITTKCLYYLLNSKTFLSQKDINSSGATQKAITNTGLEKINVNIPLLSKQDSLVKQFDLLTNIINNFHKQLEKYDTLIKSRFIEMFGDPSKNNKKWEIKKLGDIIRVLGGYAFSSKAFKESGIPVLRIGNINSGVFRPTNMVFWDDDEKIERYAIYPSDLVMSLTGTVGKDDYGNVCILGNDYPKYYLNQRNAKLEIISDLERLYLSYLLKFPEIKSRLTNISRGIRQANIANKDIENLQIPVPPLSLQNQFAAFVQQIDKSKFEYTNTGAAA